MIGSLLNSITGGQKDRDEHEGKGIGSLLVIGIIAFVLLGGTKLLGQPQEDAQD